MKAIVSLATATLLLSACTPDVVVERPFGTVTLSQGQCKNADILAMGKAIEGAGGEIDASKLKAGSLKRKDGDKVELCYTEIKGMDGYFFVIDSEGNFGNFNPKK